MKMAELHGVEPILFQIDDLLRIEDRNSRIGLEPLSVLFLLPHEVPDVAVGEAEAVPPGLSRPETDGQPHVCQQKSKR
jgi:hypothetical protein